MEFLEIDGSFGEGGGQIVRTAITLSCILHKPVIVKNIRKGRKNPGLKPQHLMALKILEKVCSAKVDHVKIGATDLKFIPGEVISIDLEEDVGTAGSIALIIQVLIPVVAICKKKLKLIIKGGTNVLWSPTIDYSMIVLKELYSRMGIDFSLNVIKRGYFPKGGGIVELEIFPCKQINPIILDKRSTKNVKLICSYSKLPSELISNKVELIEKKLIENNFIVDTKIKEEHTLDSGASLLISSIDKNSIIGIDSLFNLKQNKFDLDLDKFTHANHSVDEHLADMLVLPASLANGMTVFQVDKISKHLETNLFVASKITGCKYGIGKLHDGFEVRIEGISYPSVK
ncbi:MAG: RNA 3'-terminal phosphate cyclase [Candidatus Nitrosomaritimum yanchengensis]